MAQRSWVLRPKPPTRTAVRRPPTYLPGAFEDPDEATVGAAALPPEARRLIEQAKRREGSSEPRKHHLVPSSYLGRWAESGKLRVTETASRYSYLSSPASAARETDFYRLQSPELDPASVPPLSFEVLLAESEGEAVSAIDQLVGGHRRQDDPKGMFMLAWFMALQMTRGRSFRARLQEQLRVMTIIQAPETEEQARRLLQDSEGAVSEESVASLLTSVELLKSGDLIVEHKQASMIQLAAEAAQRLLPQLLFRDWLVYRDVFRSSEEETG